MVTKFKLKFKSKVFEAIHSAANDLFKANAISKARMNYYERACACVTPKQNLANLTDPEKKDNQ